MTAATEGLARSEQTRLVAHAKAIGADPNLVLGRFAAERLLYRLSRSPYAERFVLAPRPTSPRSPTINCRDRGPIDYRDPSH